MTARRQLPIILMVGLLVGGVAVSSGVASATGGDHQRPERDRTGPSGASDEVTPAVVIPPSNAVWVEDDHGDTVDFFTGLPAASTGAKGDVFSATAWYDGDHIVLQTSTLGQSEPGIGGFPADDHWYPGFTAATWYLDVNGDDADDYAVIYENPVDAGIVVSTYEATSENLLCNGTPDPGNGSNGVTSTFQVTIAASCIGDVDAFRFQAEVLWDNAPFASPCQCTLDWAPDGAYSPWVARPREARWYLRDQSTPGAPHYSFRYGIPGWQFVRGDWDGDGDDTIGVYVNGNWYLRNDNSRGAPDIAISYGTGGYIPVVGDWDGDGDDTIGVYDNGNWYLRNDNSPGTPHIAFSYGIGGYIPVVGDWDGGGGPDGIGVYVAGSWFLRTSPTPGPPHTSLQYGIAGYRPVSGDWDGDGDDTIGVYVGGNWYLRNSNTNGAPNISTAYGAATYTPVTGDWNNDNLDTIGVID